MLFRSTVLDAQSASEQPMFWMYPLNEEGMREDGVPKQSASVQVPARYRRTCLASKKCAQVGEALYWPSHIAQYTISGRLEIAK